MALNLFRTKSPEHLMAEAAAPERQLKRALSAFDLTCIGIGAIIGTGIFALAGTAAAGEQAHAVGSIWKTPVLNFVQSWTTHASLVFGRPRAGRRCARKLFVDYASNHCRPRDRTESSGASHCRGSDGASGLRNS